MSRFISPLQFVLGLFLAAIFLSSVASAWTGPTATAPGNNTSAPLNVSATAQVKNGNIGVNGLAVFGNTLLQGSSYLNFGSTAGTNGYGVWDNGGTLNFKNSGGSWQTIQSIVSTLIGSAGLWTSGSGGTIYYNGGNVGIGTASPNAKLEVNGTAQFDGGLTAAGILHSTGYGEDTWIPYSDGNMYFRIPSGGYAHFDALPNYNTVFAVTNSGNICLNGSCISSWPAASTATIGGSGTTGYIPRFTGATTIGNSSLTSDGNSTTANGNFFVGGYEYVQAVNGEGGTIQLAGNNGTNMWLENINGPFRLINSPWSAQLFSVDQSGNTVANGTVNASAFLYNSDERLKKDIAPLTDNLSKVLQLQPVSYRWINPALPQSEQIGFIAQQVQTIVPELVYTNASTTMEAVDYARMTPLLVGSVQELEQKITDQQSEIDQLKAAITALQAR